MRFSWCWLGVGFGIKKTKRRRRRGEGSSKFGKRLIRRACTRLAGVWDLRSCPQQTRAQTRSIVAREVPKGSVLVVGGLQSAKSLSVLSIQIFTVTVGCWVIWSSVGGHLVFHWSCWSPPKLVVVTHAASVCLSVSKLVDGVCGRCALGSRAKNGRRAFVCGVAGVLLKGRAKNGRRAFWT